MNWVLPVHDLGTWVGGDLGYGRARSGSCQNPVLLVLYLVMILVVLYNQVLLVLYLVMLLLVLYLVMQEPGLACACRLTVSCLCMQVDCVCMTRLVHPF
jgi:hypothetical protein